MILHVCLPECDAVKTSSNIRHITIVCLYAYFEENYMNICCVGSIMHVMSATLLDLAAKADLGINS